MRKRKALFNGLWRSRQNPILHSRTAAAIQNILLTAHSLGLGSCWISAFNEDKAKKAVNAPEGIRPVAIIPVGYADEIPSRRSRRPLNQTIHYGNFAAVHVS